MSELKINGTITTILQPVNGTSKAGKEWNKQDFIVNTGGEYPDNICFTLFGAKISQLEGKTINDSVNVSFNVSSREHEGKWYHNINAWKVEKLESANQNNVQADESYNAGLNNQFQQSPGPEEGSDLPF